MKYTKFRLALAQHCLIGNILFILCEGFFCLNGVNPKINDDDNDDDDADDNDDDDFNPLWATKAALSRVFAVPTHVCHRQNCKHTNMSHPFNIQIQVKYKHK